MSFQKGEIVKIQVPETIADGANTTIIGDLTFEIMYRNIDGVLTVTDEQLLEGMFFFGERMKMITEPTGCLGLAGLLHGGIDVKGKKVGVIISGGNVDMQRYSQLTMGYINSMKNIEKPLDNKDGE